MAKRLKRKQFHLKEDPFAEFIKDLAEKAKHNYEKVVVVVVLAVVVVGASFAFTSYREKTRMEASTAYQKAQESFRKGVSPSQNQQGETALKADDRVNALKEADAGFLEVMQNYAGSAEYEPSLYFRANTMFYMGEKSEALRLYQQYLGEFPTGMFAPAAKLNLAYINEQDNKRGPALEIIGEFLNAYGNSPLKLQALLDKGRISRAEANAQAKAGNQDASVQYLKAAREAYEEVLAAGEDTPFHDMAKTGADEVGKKLGIEPKAPEAAKPA